VTGATARASAAAVAITCAALLGALWTAPAAIASASRPAAISREARPAGSVRYFIVPAASNGHVESLREIAAQTLGSRSRYREIFALNKGRLQPGGARLEQPGVIKAGWILRLPADARGPGVHFGPLPGPAAAGRTPAPAPSATTASDDRPFAGTSLAGPVGAIAAVLAATGLALWLSRRRPDGHRWPRGRRRAEYEADDGGGYGVTHAELAWLDSLGDPGWAAGWGSAPVLHPDHPSAPMPRIRDVRNEPAPPSRASEPGEGGAPSGAVTPAAGGIWEPYQDAGRAGFGARDDSPDGWRDTGGTADTDTSLLARRVLAEAGDRAAGITQRAHDDAAALLAAAGEQTAAIREQAAEMAASIRAAADRDASEIRAAVTAVSAELMQLTARVTGSSPATEQARPPEA
jgi:hypothetical protein